MPARLNPYLNFDGRAREAMEFYRDVFGGELTTQTFAEGGMSQGPDDANLVMHAQLEADDGMTLMGADVPPSMEYQAPAGFGISLSGDDDAMLSGYWDKLVQGGSVTMPLETAPWGDKFGMLTDRYGVPWMVNIAGTVADAGG
jgi:PhnB protein